MNGKNEGITIKLLNKPVKLKVRLYNKIKKKDKAKYLFNCPFHGNEWDGAPIGFIKTNDKGELERISCLLCKSQGKNWEGLKYLQALSDNNKITFVE